jgi:hypothetical protein
LAETIDIMTPGGRLIFHEFGAPIPFARDPIAIASTLVFPRWPLPAVAAD